MTGNPDKAVEYIMKTGKLFAEAKAHRIYMEEYRKSLKALLMSKSRESSVAAQEREAYSNDQYLAHLELLRDAVAAEETHRWGLVAAQARIDVWRSLEASNRQEVRATM